MAEHFPHLLEVLPERADVTKETLELLWRAAPEQVRELDQLFAAGAQARLVQYQSAQLGAVYGAVQIPEKSLRQIWLLAHAAWQELLDFEKLKNGEPIGERVLIESAVKAAVSLGIDDNLAWPKEIPSFLDHKSGTYAKAIRELFAMAAAWAIFHEMRHAKFDGEEGRPQELIAEEIVCDEYALRCLFSDIDKYSKLTGESEEKVRAKRAMGAMVGLYLIAKLSNKNSGTHPPVQSRMKALFDAIGDDPAANFWGFAIALLVGLNPQLASMRVPPDASLREGAYLALKNS